MKPEKVNLRVRLAGRTFFLETYPVYEPLIRAAVERLDRRFGEMKLTYEADEPELLAMLLIQEVAEKEKILFDYKEERQRQQEEWEKIETVIREIDLLNNK